ADLAAATRNPLRRVYQAVDEAIGTILAEAGDAAILIVSLHGMGSWFGAPFLLPEILVRLGVTVPVSPPAAKRTPRTLGIAAARAIWKSLPESIRSRLRPLRRRMLPDPPKSPPTLGIVPGQSRCFAVGNGAPVGAIRLNLRGREPEGQINPGPEADRFENQLIVDLLDIQDDRTGRPAIRRVLRTRDLFDGPELARLPDLLVEWDDREPTGSMLLAEGRGATVSLSSPRIGMVTGVNWYGRSGDHRPGGKYFLLGPGVEHGSPAPAVDVAGFAAAIVAAVHDRTPMEATLRAPR
ncbi:MAG: hypothetical protein SGI84_11845, partial [Gemmatimonadota bacterium]|nr:hypothetical protein [Gemmatimonadota bacterium]